MPPNIRPIVGRKVYAMLTLFEFELVAYSGPSGPNLSSHIIGRKGFDSIAHKACS